MENKLNSKSAGLDETSRNQLFRIETENDIKKIKEILDVLNKMLKDVNLHLNGLSSRIYAIEQNLLPAQEAPKEESKGKLSDFLRRIGL